MGSVTYFSEVGRSRTGDWRPLKRTVVLKKARRLGFHVSASASTCSFLARPLALALEAALGVRCYVAGLQVLEGLFGLEEALDGAWTTNMPHGGLRFIRKPVSYS